MNFRYHIILNKHGLRLVISRHKTLKRAQEKLRWLDNKEARIVELGDEDDQG